MCHSSHDPPTFPVMYENTTRAARTQWKSRIGRSQIRTGFTMCAALFRAIVVVAGLAGGSGVGNLLLQCRKVSGACNLGQLRGLRVHALHLLVEVRLVRPE